MLCSKQTMQKPLPLSDPLLWAWATLCSASTVIRPTIQNSIQQMATRRNRFMARVNSRGLFQRRRRFLIGVLSLQNRVALTEPVYHRNGSTVNRKKEWSGDCRAESILVMETPVPICPHESNKKSVGAVESCCLHRGNVCPTLSLPVLFLFSSCAGVRLFRIVLPTSSVLLCASYFAQQPPKKVFFRNRPMAVMIRLRCFMVFPLITC